MTEKEKGVITSYESVVPDTDSMYLLNWRDRPAIRWTECYAPQPQDTTTMTDTNTVHGGPVAWRWRNPGGVWNYQEAEQRIPNVEQQPLYLHPTPQTDTDAREKVVEALTKALSDMLTFYGQPDHAVTDGQRKANRSARALLKEISMDAAVTWAETAKALGWKWSAADDAFVHDNMPHTPNDVQDCCALHDIETLGQARTLLAALKTGDA